MDAIKALMATQLTERELMVFLLVDSGMEYSDIARRLLTNHTNIKRAYLSAQSKMDKMSTLFSTPVEKSSK